MELSDAIEKLKKHISNIYLSTGNKIGDNIYRGHLRTISTDIEDGIAIFISDILPGEYKIFLDSSIHIGGKKNRPDLLVVDSNNNVKAMVEIKANMGWCRNASMVIDDIILSDIMFKTHKNLTCEFSREENQKIFYGENVKLFLVAFTDNNSSLKNHVANKLYASKFDVFQFNLFTGWYDSLSNCEIEEFGKELVM
ncbi:MAG: hypothetical protein CVV57_05615 [Tenericutes bacterium HGW-Tenericutes-2]|jgi:hypothetical protein|nr:MAG: hypothetical protein CVV57_05615 [Tenericutes bacterium HGW-Tenericutes-2]